MEEAYEVYDKATEDADVKRLKKVYEEMEV